MDAGRQSKVALKRPSTFVWLLGSPTDPVEARLQWGLWAELPGRGHGGNEGMAIVFQSPSGAADESLAMDLPWSWPVSRTSLHTESHSMAPFHHSVIMSSTSGF